MPPSDNLSERLATLVRYVHDMFVTRWQTGANRRSVLAIISIGMLLLVSYVFFFAPPSRFPVGDLILVPEGVSARETGRLLEEQGVVRNGTAFSLAVTILGAERGVRAGDYLFKERRGLIAVTRAITTGAFGLEPIRIRVPEGATTQEMAELFAGYLQRFNADRFIAMAQPQEGFLFPDTYFFLPNANEEVVFRALRQNFDTNVASIAGEIESFGRPLEDIVIMASLLEREAHNMNDRRMIAGVLWRRIEINMPLQVDVSFLYSIGRSTFTLTREDLTNEDDPYNTYVHRGLPPSAIGSPSLSSLRAAVTPIDEGYLFYLADRNYVTYYSRTYEEHLRKKAIYVDS